MFNAYASRSNDSILDMKSAKKLIKKLLILDAVDCNHLRFAVSYSKYPNLPYWYNAPPDLKNFTKLGEDDAKKLHDYLNKNGIECKIRAKTMTSVTTGGVKVGIGTWQYMDFPSLLYKDELIQKLNELFEPDANNRSRQSNSARG